ncbi:MAG: hypothetical protein V1871_09360 [Planctomycetota bacterium]
MTRILAIILIVIIVIGVPLLAGLLTNNAEWGIVTGTLLVGLGAIFQSYIVNLIWYPELHISISLKPNDDDCHKIPVDILRQTINSKVVDSADAYYFNLRVKNTGNVVAENVEVAILGLWKEENSLYKKVDFPPMNIYWRHDRTIVVKDRIVPLMDTHFTLGRIIHPEANYDRRMHFSLLPIVEMNSNPHILLPGNYRLKIGMSAKKVKTIVQTYHLWFNGQWDSDENIMLTNNISIRPIENITEKEWILIKSETTQLMLRRNYRRKE